MSMEKFGGRKITWTGEVPPAQAERALARQKPEIQRPTAEIIKIREALAFIDFGVVRTLFSELYERHGFDPEQMNFFELEMISNKAGFGNDAMYDGERNGLGIDIDNIARRSATENLDLKLATAGILFHEETHALGRVACHFDEARKNLPLLSFGYSIAVDDPLPEDQQAVNLPHERQLFQSFNEGVTELIAHDILGEYAKRTEHFSDEEVQGYVDNRRSFKGIELVESHIQMLAERSQISAEEARDFVIKQYFTETNSLEQMVRDYPGLADGDGYFAQLANE